MKGILSRRSIRSYTSEAVSEQDVRELLEAAMAAPSAGNQQPWQFVVITERKLLDQIPQFHPHAPMLKQAPLAILVCGDMQKEKYEGSYWVQDCSAATQNILLGVEDKGLGAVWLGVYPRQERVNGLRNLLGIPEHVVPFSLIAIGHPAEKLPPAARFDASLIHYNKW